MSLCRLKCRAFLLAMVLLAFAGCKTTPERPPDTEASAIAPHEGPELPRWRYVRFRLQRGGDGEAARFMDALIVDQILADAG